MEALAQYRYDAVRYSPINSELYPFQVLGSSERTDVPHTAVIALTIEQAVDLYNSLGVMITRGATDV